MSTFSYLASLTLAGVFVTSGLAKFGTGSFTADLAAYRILPEAWIVPAARLLPGVEVVIATALLVGIMGSVALSLAAVLLVTFSVGMATNLLRGRSIPCGCRGRGTPISWSLVVANIALASLALTSVVTGATGVLPVLLGNGSTSPKQSRRPLSWCLRGGFLPLS